MGPRHGARDARRAGRLDPGPVRGRHHVQRQQHPVHHHQREPRSHQLAPHPREDHQPSRTASETDRQIFGRQPADPGEVRLVVAALPHHLLRQVGAAQVALLLPLRAAPRHHSLHRAGIHRLPLVEARRAEPRLDRTGQGDRPPAGNPDLVAAGMDRIPAFAGCGPDGRRGDEQGPHAPDEDRGPFFENRLRDAPHPGEHQRSGGRIGHVFPQAHSPQRDARLQRTGHRPRAGQHQRRTVRMGRGEPDEKLARRPARPRSHRRADFVGRQERYDRRERHGQGHSQEQLETHLRTGIHDQDPRLGPRAVALRIVEEYHQGKIAVIDSEIGKGTTIRITLKRHFA